MRFLTATIESLKAALAVEKARADTAEKELAMGDARAEAAFAALGLTLAKRAEWIARAEKAESALAVEKAARGRAEALLVEQSMGPDGQDLRVPLDEQEQFDHDGDRWAIEALRRWVKSEKAAFAKEGSVFDTGFRCVSEGGDIFYFDPEGVEETLDALAAAQKRIEALEGALRVCEGWARNSPFVRDRWLWFKQAETIRSVLDAAPAALASPSESAPQPTPETRVDLEALEKLLAEATKPPWVLRASSGAGDDHLEWIEGDGRGVMHTGESCLCAEDCKDKAAVVALRNAAPSMIAELRARRAAPTGQQQEAGALANLRAKRDHYNAVEGNDDSMENLLEALDAFLDAPAAAPRSAPQEGLFKEGALAMREAIAAHFESKADEQRKLVEKLLSVWRGRIPEHHGDESERYNRKRFSVQLNGLAREVRALPLPESALLTKAAPLTQPAVPEKEVAEAGVCMGAGREDCCLSFPQHRKTLAGGATSLSTEVSQRRSHMRVLVDKQALIDKLVANRENHRAVFLKALDNFKKAATEKFEANLDRLRSGKMPELYITFSVPTDETRQYDSAISLLRLATEDRVELNENDHQKYVLDQWEWTKQWKATSNAYGHVVADDDEPAE